VSLIDKVKSVFSKPPAPTKPAKAKRTGGVNAEYDAGKTSDKRKLPTAKLTHEDEQLKLTARKQLIANARTQRQNYALIAWMIRQHLAYVSQFIFQPQVKDKEGNTLTPVNKALLDFFEWHGKRRNFSADRRHNRDRAMRLFEGSKVVDGDVGLLKTILGRLQGIPRHRIGAASDAPDSVDKNTGLILNEYGGVKKYALCKYEKGSKSALKHEKLVNEQDMIFGAYFEGSFDQTRGISPLSSALNFHQDMISGWAWTLLKIKAHAILGWAIMSEDDEDDENDGMDTTTQEGTDTDETEDPEVETDSDRYDITIQDGLYKLELNKGDKVDLLSSETPNSEIVPWSELVIRVILLCLDIPYSIYNSFRSSSSAGIADPNNYKKLCKPKQADNQEALDEYTEFILHFDRKSEEADDELIRRLKALDKVLAKHSLTVDDIRWKWIPSGLPWYSKVQEITGDALAIAIGQDSPQRACNRRGLNIYDIIDETAEAYEYAKDKGVPLLLGPSGNTVLNLNVNTGDGQIEDKTNANDQN